jgi:hypothetical protein
MLGRAATRIELKLEDDLNEHEEFLVMAQASKRQDTQDQQYTGKLTSNLTLFARN